METSDPTGEQPMPVMPLNYQKPAPVPWRPVRMAMGVYLLTAGAGALAQFLLPLAGGMFRGLGGGPMLSVVSFFVYVSSGVFFTVAGIGFLTNSRWRGTWALVAQIISSTRAGLQLFSIYAYQFSRTTFPPGYWWQMAGSWASAVIIPLSLLFLIVAFNRYDRAQDEPLTWT